MNAQISNIEIQLIKSSLATKTDDEIAELLEIPVEEVVEFINEITEGGAADRNADILKQREEISRAKMKKRVVKEYQEATATRAEIRIKEKQALLNAEERRKVEKRTQHQFRKYKTRKQEFDNMISIKVDIKTWVLAPAGSDIEKVKAQYNKNLKR